LGESPTGQRSSSSNSPVQGEAAGLGKPARKNEKAQRAGRSFLLYDDLDDRLDHMKNEDFDHGLM
jgi:hypothetical protein